MRIAIFADYFLGLGGGTEVSIKNQKQALEADGHTVWVVTPNSKPVSGEFTNILTLPTVPLLRIAGQKIYWPLPFIKTKIAQFLVKERIDLVHVQTEFSVGALGYQTAKLTGLPVVHTLHTLLWYQADKTSKMPRLATLSAFAWHYLNWRYLPASLPRFKNETWSSWGWRRMVLQILNLADRVVSPSDHLAAKLEQWSKGAIKPVVIANPSSTTNLPKVQKLPSSTRFIWIGRLSAEKRPLECIEAFIKLKQLSDKDFKLDLYGGGPLLKQCLKLAKNQNFITIHGPASHNKVQQAIATSTALVLTSYDFDNQPMVMIEAFLAGRGVICCDPALVDKSSQKACFVTSPDSQKMASQLYDLLRQPNVFKNMSIAAIATAQRFDPNTYSQSIMRLYTDATQSNKLL